MKAKNKKSFREVLHYILEEEAAAITMAYAGSRGDYETVRLLEDRFLK